MSASSWDETIDVAPPAVVTVPAVRWNPITRVLFRFAFSYLILYNFPFPLDYFWPKVFGVFGRFDEQMWRAIVPAVGKRFFGLTITIFTNGSGDTTYDYVKALCMLVVAVAVTLIWSILDRRRLAYTRLHGWLHVYVRFALGAAMIAYGVAKVIPPTQFPAPTIDRLTQPFGDASPMGLVWTFMGASAAYTFFTGVGELLSGVLLMIRRTALLGSLIGIAALANIVALSFFYDVPVKLFSSHLLAMAVFLVLPDTRRLAQFFVLHPPSQLFQRKSRRIAGFVLGTAVALFIIFSAFQQATGIQIPRAPIRGIWNVDTLTVDGVDHPPLVTDGTRWRRLVFDYAQTVAFQNMFDSRTRYGLELSESNGMMHLKKRNDPKWSATLFFKRPAPNEIVLDGSMDGHMYHALLHKANEQSFHLTTRGFHWINEYPYNR